MIENEIFTPLIDNRANLHLEKLKKEHQKTRGLGLHRSPDLSNNSHKKVVE